MNKKTHLFIGNLKKLGLGVLHVTDGSTDCNLVLGGAFLREADDNTAILLHDGADQLTLGSNDGIMKLVGDVNCNLLDVSLKIMNENEHCGNIDPSTELHCKLF